MKLIFKLLGISGIFSGWYLKNKYGWLGSLIQPLSFLIMMGVVGGSHMYVYALIGACISLIWMGGVSSLPQFLLLIKLTRLKDMFVAAPIHPLIYMLGAALSVFVASLPPMILFLILLIIHLKISFIELLILISVLLATWLMSCALGFTVAGYVKDQTRIGTIAPWLGAILTAMPPVYYPLEALPAQYQLLALLIPTTHLAQIERVSLHVTTPIYNPLLHILSICAYLALFILLAAFRSRWRER